MAAPATIKLLACVWLLAAVRQASSALNVTQAILDNIQGPSSLGTRASNFTTTSNYTAITQILATNTDFSRTLRSVVSCACVQTGLGSSHDTLSMLCCMSCLINLLRADDEIALGNTVFAVAGFVGTPLGWQVGPLLTRAIAKAAVPIAVQIAAYDHAVAKASFLDLNYLNDTTATPEQRASNAEQVAEGFSSGFSNNFDMPIILTGIQPQVDQGLFTFKDIMAKVAISQQR